MTDLAPHQIEKPPVSGRGVIALAALLLAVALAGLVVLLATGSDAGTGSPAPKAATVAPAFASVPTLRRLQPVALRRHAAHKRARRVVHRHRHRHRRHHVAQAIPASVAPPPAVRHTVVVPVPAHVPHVHSAPVRPAPPPAPAPHRHSGGGTSPPPVKFDSSG